MSYTDTNPSLPFQGKDDTSRECSRQAAVAASRSRFSKSQRYLGWLKIVGRACDHEAAVYFGWPLSSINSIRNGLDELIMSDGTTMGPHGKRVTQWKAR